jgi:hypothetical protein
MWERDISGKVTDNHAIKLWATLLVKEWLYGALSLELNQSPHWPGLIYIVVCWLNDDLCIMLYSGKEARGQSTYILLYSFNTFYRCFDVVFLVAVLVVKIAIALTAINFWMRLSLAKGISKDSTFATSVIAGLPN